MKFILFIFPLHFLLVPNILLHYHNIPFYRHLAFFLHIKFSPNRHIVLLKCFFIMSHININDNSFIIFVLIRKTPSYKMREKRYFFCNGKILFSKRVFNFCADYIANCNYICRFTLNKCAFPVIRKSV